jgi:hypothetical protein
MHTFLHIANFFPSRNAKEAQEKNSLKKSLCGKSLYEEASVKKGRVMKVQPQ